MRSSARAVPEKDGCLCARARGEGGTRRLSAKLERCETAGEASLRGVLMGVLEVEEIAEDEDEAVDVVFASKGAGRLRVWWSPDDEVGLDEGVAWWGCAIGTEGAMHSSVRVTGSWG